MSASRPGPGTPRTYHFPRAFEHRTANGIRIIAVPMPQRPLAAVQLLLPGGASSESAATSGSTAMLARLLTEGGAQHNAEELVEATELLGASLAAEAGWEGVVIGASVPATRIAGVLELIAEIALGPSIPEREVERGKALRLASIEQAQASPRARASEALIASIYRDDAAYGRPIAGTRESVAAITRERLMQRHHELLQAAQPILVLAGEFDPTEIFTRVAASSLAALPGGGAGVTRASADMPAAPEAPGGPALLILDRPGSVQSELRVGRLGRSRLDPQFHAALVHAEIVGGLFGSRLNRVLREEKGYTYGAAAGFDFRRGRGPFTMRTAVETSVTVPALLEARRQVESPLHEPVTQSELDDARNYLRGTFPLRFGAAAPVSATVAGLSVIGLNVEELNRYRDAVTAVDAAAVTQVALDLSHEAERIVVVGDAAQIAEPLRAEGFVVTVKPAIPA